MVVAVVGVGPETPLGKLAAQVILPQHLRHKAITVEPAVTMMAVAEEVVVLVRLEITPLAIPAEMAGTEPHLQLLELQSPVQVVAAGAQLIQQLEEPAALAVEEIRWLLEIQEHQILEAVVEREAIIRPQMEAAMAALA
jgi:hypothetical protein